MTDIARGDGIALVRSMVRIDSRNPSLVPGAPGERALATFLRDTLSAWGLEARLQEAAPGHLVRCADLGALRELAAKGEAAWV